MKNPEHNYSPNEIEALEKSRAVSDKNLEKGGAKKVVTTRLELTDKQEKSILKEHSDEESEKAGLEKELASLLAKAEKIKAKLGKTGSSESVSEQFPTAFEISHNPEITSAETAIAFLEKLGHTVGDYAKDMLANVNWKETLKSSYEVVSVTVDDLFNDGEVHTYKEIKDKADELGLTTVPARLAPEIRANYDKNGEWTAIAMKAINDRDGNPSLFRCGWRDSESWLRSGSCGRDGSEWVPGDRFFFVRE